MRALEESQIIAYLKIVIFQAIAVSIQALLIEAS